VASVRRWRPQVHLKPLEFIFQNQRVAVVNKPAGLLSVLGTDARVNDSVESRLQAQWPQAKLVHRLDLETSGVLVAALDAEAFVFLQKQFQKRAVKKRYVAVVQGLVEADAGRIELWLRADLDMRPRQLVDPLHGKKATTDFQVLERRDGTTRLHLYPHEGRTHQLRVHTSHALGLGRPIVGDSLYGQPAARMMLHAEQLELEWPDVGRQIVTSWCPF
jgi:tRNA pseudouridine32 synthase / 23S rRNA pseudouridine746 synthase